MAATAVGRPIGLLLKPFTVDGLLDHVRQSFEARTQTSSPNA